MTEYEIIDYLKENKHKGVAFAFLPKDVKVWCMEHKNEEFFIVYRGNRWDINSCIRCDYNGIYSLPGWLRSELPYNVEEGRCEMKKKDELSNSDKEELIESINNLQTFCKSQKSCFKCVFCVALSYCSINNPRSWNEAWNDKVLKRKKGN